MDVERGCLLELEDIVYEIKCLTECMLAGCADRSGSEDPVIAHYGMTLRRLVRDLESVEEGQRCAR